MLIKLSDPHPSLIHSYSHYGVLCYAISLIPFNLLLLRFVCRAIILGVLMRFCGLASAKGVVSGEYFIKIGIVLMVMNFGNIASVGVRGLVSSL